MEIPEFGIKRENEERRDGGCAIVFDSLAQKFAVGKQTEDGFLRLFSGGVDKNEDIQEGILREVREESGLYDFGHIEKIGEAFAHFHNTLKKVNRVAHATCFLVILKSTKLTEVKLEAHEKFYLVWVTAEELLANWNSINQNKDVDHWIYFLEKSMERITALSLTSPRR